MSNQIALINEESLDGLIFEIRGQKVMLDYDLARIYGYETKAFNQQVKRNAERFPADFYFRVNKQEFNQILMSQIVTARKWTVGNKGGRTSLPYAFTEQGVYMLMSVLKGDLATAQSIALIRLFKKMKDTINEGQGLVALNDFRRLEEKTNRNTEAIGLIESKLDVVMNYFSDPSTYKHFLILDGERIESDLAYRSIFERAEASIILIDDYIGLKTLSLLKSSGDRVSITIISDNRAKNGVTEQDLADFSLDTGKNIILLPTGARVHDRYIVLDYGSEEEALYHCGASNKDGGRRVSTIMRVENPEDYHRLLEELLNHVS